MIAALGDGADDGGAEGVGATVARGLVVGDAAAAVAAGAAGAEQPATATTAARIATSGRAMTRIRAWPSMSGMRVLPRSIATATASHPARQHPTSGRYAASVP